MKTKIKYGGVSKRKLNFPHFDWMMSSNRPQAVGARLSWCRLDNNAINNMAAQMENSEQSAAAIQKSISAAFDIFDHESNKTVDMR